MSKKREVSLDEVCSYLLEIKVSIYGGTKKLDKQGSLAQKSKDSNKKNNKVPLFPDRKLGFNNL